MKDERIDAIIIENIENNYNDIVVCSSVPDSVWNDRDKRVISLDN